jgi:tetratricopeptide (TPR) repeat protein
MFALLAALPTRAAAQGSRPGTGSVLDVASPERESAIRMLQEARARLADALDGDRDVSLGPATDVLIEQAVARYDAVLEVFPEHVDALLEEGVALAHFSRTQPDGTTELRVDEAIAALEHARRIEPERDAGAVSFELAVLYTRRGDLAHAEREYARAYERMQPYPVALEHDLSRRERSFVYLLVLPERPLVLGNWAEVTMLSGDAPAAVERYRGAFEASPRGSVSAALALWGLALAEERAGSHADAIETALRAIDARPRELDPVLVERWGAFAPLHAGGVFFEPACEIHAYEALGHEALATRASTPEGRAAELAAARRSTRSFLGTGGRASIYASVALAAEERLSSPAVEPRR